MQRFNIRKALSHASPVASRTAAIADDAARLGARTLTQGMAAWKASEPERRRLASGLSQAPRVLARAEAALRPIRRGRSTAHFAAGLTIGVLVFACLPRLLTPRR